MFSIHLTIQSTSDYYTNPSGAGMDGRIIVQKSTVPFVESDKPNCYKMICVPYD